MAIKLKLPKKPGFVEQTLRTRFRGTWALEKQHTYLRDVLITWKMTEYSAFATWLRERRVLRQETHQVLFLLRLQCLFFPLREFLGCWRGSPVNEIDFWPRCHPPDLHQRWVRWSGGVSLSWVGIKRKNDSSADAPDRIQWCEVLYVGNDRRIYLLPVLEKDCEAKVNLTVPKAWGLFLLGSLWRIYL